MISEELRLSTALCWFILFETLVAWHAHCLNRSHGLCRVPVWQLRSMLLSEPLRGRMRDRLASPSARCGSDCCAEANGWDGGDGPGSTVTRRPDAS